MHTCANAYTCVYMRCDQPRVYTAIFARARTPAYGEHGLCGLAPVRRAQRGLLGQCSERQLVLYGWVQARPQRHGEQRARCHHHYRQHYPGRAGQHTGRVRRTRFRRATVMRSGLAGEDTTRRHGERHLPCSVQRPRSERRSLRTNVAAPPRKSSCRCAARPLGIIVSRLID
jgi:hypothetical protein